MVATVDHIPDITPSPEPRDSDLDIASSPLDEKYDEKGTIETIEEIKGGGSHIKTIEDVPEDDPDWVCPAEWHNRLVDEYTGYHEGEALPAGADADRAVKAIMTIPPKAAVKALQNTLKWHARDLTFMDLTRNHINRLLEGPAALGLDYDDWSYEVCKTAGKQMNYSPYPEVRSVTLPYDDVDEPCETIRAWVLGMFWLIGVTCINTFFNPRQPAIKIPGAVVQLLLVPMGHLCAKVLPDWGFTFRGKRHSLNPGPWSVKEQLLATIIQSAAGSGNIGGLLALRMPQFFNQRWITFGFEMCLGIANQGFGLGGAGLLRRLSVYPVQAVWPQSLPTLALVRALIHTDHKKREVINGWRISRWTCFMIASLVFLLYYWFPNNIAGFLQRFDWMCWIAPKNFNVNIVTGAYGGMGFNPISTFDLNYSGVHTMESPFFAQLQQYILRCIGGIVILAMYYANMSWTAFMPINTSSAFSNTAAVYNSSRILNKDNSFNTTAYHNYSPPYLSAAALFKTGGEFAFYTITLCYVFIRYWHPIYKAFSGVYQNIRHRRSDMDGFEDAHTRMMRSYPEVPEWWFLIVLLIGFAITVVTLEHFPTDTPFWSIFAFVGIGYFLLVPWCIIESIAATGIGFDTMWHLLPGLWWPGKLVPHLVIVMLGSAFEYQAGGFMIDLKYCQYAHIPPRAVFRGHIVSTVVNVLFYVIIIDWLVTGYSPATFCNMDDPQRMVCQNPRSVWTQTIFYGIFGTTKLFKMYPILPWCFLIGAIIGITWGIVELNAPSFMRHLKTRMSEKSFHAFEKYFWNPAAMVLCYINPAIALSGMLNWSAQNNLSMYTTGIYLAWYFQYYLKRYKTAWWSKYAYIMFAGISVGITISGLISTLSFGFGSGLGKSLKWWGNHASVNTINYKAYTDKKEGVRLQVPKDRGYFGLDSTNYP